MTTDRTAAAPPRSTALAERSPAAGRQAPPADAFSALLGASASAETAAPAPRRDDAPRRDEQPRHEHPQRAERRPDAPRPEQAEAPVDDAPAPAENEEPAVAAVSASLFALQLASPLPPASPFTAMTPATPEQLAAGDTSKLPTFTGFVPASIAAATVPDAPVVTEPVAPAIGTATLTAEVAASVATETPVDAELAHPAPALTPAPVTAEAPADDTPVALPASAAQPQTGAQTQEQPDAQPQAASTTPTAKPAETPAAEAAPATAPTATASTNAAPATPPVTPAGLERTVPLRRAVETTSLMLHVAAERGVTHARLNLKPVELGGIEVKLQSTPEGIHARLIADSPEAARMLQQAGDDLRRNLEARDVNLLSLDVSTSGDGQRQPAQFGFSENFGDRYRPASSSAFGRGGDDEPAPAETTLALPNGVLVDVLA